MILREAPNQLAVIISRFHVTSYIRHKTLDKNCLRKFVKEDKIVILSFTSNDAKFGESYDACVCDSESQRESLIT